VCLSVLVKPGQMRRPWPTSGFRAPIVKCPVDAVPKNLYVCSINLIFFDEQIQCFRKVAYYYSK